MSNITRALTDAFVEALQGAVLWHSDLNEKPLLIDLHRPLPHRLRVYLFSLVAGGKTRRAHEYKAVLRVPGQKVGDYGSFNSSDERIVVVIAYDSDLDVFVLWDSSLHPRFKNGGNIQVRDVTVFGAASCGLSHQIRRLSFGATELVIACQSWTLKRGLSERVLKTGDQTGE